MTDSKFSTDHIVTKIILLATGTPGATHVRDALITLYETNGDWDEVATVIDNYMNMLLAQNANGIPGLVKALASNGFGVQLSLAEAQTLTNEFAAIGIDSWSGLFGWLHENVDGNLATVWNNRAESASEFTGMLGTLNKSDDYNGAQALAAAREWVNGIGASDSSMQTARESASELIGRFIDGKVKGVAIDGYVVGATVFIDVNGNGTRDDGEPFTVTDSSGNFVFAEDVLPAGKLIGRGGIDLATGQPFEGEMLAPGGASVISPLTTLVEQMMASDPSKSQADIEDSIFATLGIPRVDLSSFDPIKAGLDPNGSRESQVNAAKIQAVTSQLVNVMSVSAALTVKLSSGNTSAGSSSILALASSIKQAALEGRTISLSNSETLASIVQSAVRNSGVINEQSSVAEQEVLTRLSAEVGQALKGINTKTQQAVDALTNSSGNSVVDALSDMYKLQKLTQTEVSPSIRATQTEDLQEVVTQYNGSNLDGKIKDVQAGSLTEGTVTTPGNVTRPQTDPVVPQSPTLKLARDSGTLDNDAISNTGTVTVGNLLTDGRWEFSVDGINWTAGRGDSAELNGDGSKTVLVRQFDADGNVSANTSINFTLDSTGPAALGVSLADDTGASNSDAISNNNQINFDLIALEEGVNWEYSLDGTTWTVGTDNSISVEDDGEKTVSVRQIDIAGNVGVSSSVTFTLDTAAPSNLGLSLADDAGSSASDAITNNRLVNFDLTALEEGAKWEYSLDGTTWTTGTDNSVSVEGDGEKTVSVRQTDVAGNIGASSSVSFTLDTAAPSGLGVTLAGDSGSSASDAVTNNRQVNFDLAALEEGAKWEYSLDGTTWTSGTENSVSVEGDGEKTVSIRQIDVAGNIGASSSVTFTLDTAAPTTLGVSLSDDSGSSASDAITNNRLVNFDLTALEEGAKWEYSVDGTTWNAGTESSVSVEGDGEKTVFTRQTDVAGNVGVSSSVTFTMDTAVPSNLGVSLADDTGTSVSDAITNNRQVNFDLAALEEGAKWEYSVDGTTWNTGTESSVSVEGDGEKTVSIRQIDVAGNIGASSSVSFTLDTAAPTTLGVSLSDDSGSSASDAITNNRLVNFDLAALEEGAKWEYSLDGTTWTSGAESSVSVEGDGEKTVSVRQVDIAGNVGASSSVTFTLDTATPTTLGVSLAEDSGSSISDSISNNRLVNFDLTALEEGAKWEYSLDGTTWTIGTESSVSVEGDGEKTVSIRQIDVAGNIGASSSVSFTLDTAAPSAIGVTLASDSGSSASDAVTNNRQVNFDLAALEEGAKWEYSLDGTTWTSGAESSVSVEGDGEKTISVRQVDIAGNVGASSSVTFTLDTATPTSLGVSLAEDSGSSISDSISNNRQVNFDLATLEEGAKWEYSLDGTTWTVGTESSVSVEGDGDKTVSVRQTDVAGNIGASSSVSFTLDTAAPTGLGVTLEGDSGTSTSDAITNNRQVNFDLAALEEGAKWEYTLDGITWTAGTANSVSVEGDGEKTISARQIDVAGNIGASSSVSFTLDTTAPSGLGASLADDSGSSDTDTITNNRQVNFDLTALEEGAKWVYSVDGTTWNAGTESSVSVEGEGEKTVSIRQIDVAGNIGASSSVSFTLDTTAPSGLGASLADDSGSSASDAITNNRLVNFDLTALEEGAKWEYSVDGTTWNAGTEISVSVEGDGEKTVSIRQIDVAGNIGASSSVSFTLDTAAPTTLGVSLSDDSGSSASDAITNNRQVNFDLAALEDGAKWEYSLDGTTWTAGSESSISVEGDGEKTVSVRQVDIAGNVGASSSVTFTLDTATPTSLGVSLSDDSGSSDTDTITNNRQVNFELTALEVGAKWEYSLDGTTWTTGTDNSVSVEGDGEKTISVRQIDVAGNIGASSSVSFTLDTAAPTILGVSLSDDSGSSASDAITNNRQVNFDLTTLEEGAKWEYTLDGITWTAGTANSVSVEGDGEKTVSVRQVDIAGNVGASSSVTFTLDTATPTTLGVSLAEDSGSSISDSISNNRQVNFDLTALEEGAKWEYTLDGTTWTVGTESSVSVEGDGEKTISARQIDVAGNIGASSSVTFTLDTAAPTTLGVSLSDDSGSSDTDTITNNRQVNFDLAALEDGAKWEYSLDGTTWTAGSESSISVEGDGEKTVSVRQVDIAGNVGASSSVTFTLDTATPTSLGVSLADDSGSSASDAITNNRLVNFDLTVLEEGAKWEYTLDGTTWTVGTESSVSVEGDGEKTISARQIDVAGNIGASSSVTFILDTAAPTILGVSLSDDSGSSASDAITNNRQVNFDLAALEDGAKWEYSLDGTTWTAGSESSISVEGDGEKTISVRQVDIAGNVGASSSVTFTLDTATPTSLGVSLADDSGSSASDAITNNRLVNFDLTVLEEGAKWEYTLDGTTWTVGTESSVSVEGDGEKTISARQIDVAGNIGASSSVTFTLDTAAPTTLGVSLSDDSGSSDTDTITNNRQVNFDLAALEEGAKWEYSVDGTTWNTGTESSVSVEGDGEKTISVRQIDIAGNVGTSSSVTFTLDTFASALGVSLQEDTGSSGFDGVTNNAQVNFDLTALEEGASWEYSLDGGNWNAGSDSTIAVEGGGNGAKSVSVRQTDQAGNVSTASTVNFTLDTFAPALGVSLAEDTGASDGLTNNGQVNFDLTALEEGASWEYSLDGSTWTAGTDSSVTVEGDGAKTVSVRQTDVAGNVSVSGTVSFTLDTTAPTTLPTLTLATSVLVGEITYTNDKTVLITGLEEGATWEVRGGGYAGSWESGSGGSLELLVANGEIEVQVRPVDKTGNVQSNWTALNFVLDTSVPEALGVTLEEDTGTSTSDGITRNPFVDFDLTALEEGASWEYSLDGENWNAGSDSTIAVEGGGNGAKSVSVRQTDQAGNVSTASTVNFTLDTYASALGVSLQDDAGSSDSDGVSNNGQVNFDLTALEEGASWEYTLDGSNWITGTANSVAVEGDGEKTVSVRQSDVAGNLGVSSSINFTLDTAAPAALAVTLAEDSGTSASDGVTNNPQVNFDLTALEEGAKWEYSLDGSTWIMGTENSVSVEGDGEKIVTVRQIDVAGNRSDSATKNFTLVTSAPALGVSLQEDAGPSDSDGVTNNGQVNFDLTALGEGASWQYTLDGTNWVAGSTNNILIDTDGGRTVAVRQIDVAGNFSETESLNFTLDTSSPGRLRYSSVTTNNPLVTLPRSWPNAAGIKVRGDGFSEDWLYFDGDTFEIKGGDGFYSLTVKQVDLAGNENIGDRFDVTLDTTAPAYVNTPTVVSSGNAISVTISAVGTAGLYRLSDDSLITFNSGLAANSPATVNVAVQDSVTDAYLKVSDSLGNTTIATVSNIDPSTNAAVTSNIVIKLGTSGADSIIAADDGANFVFGFGGGDTYIYGGPADSRVLNEASAASGFDVVAVTDGDIFDYIQAIESVTNELYYVGQVPKTNGDELLAQLNGYFLSATGGTTTGIHAMAASIGNNQKFFMIDVDADQQITEDDLVVQIIELTGISNHETWLTLTDGNVSFGFAENSSPA